MADTEKSNEDIPKRITRGQATKIAEETATKEISENDVIGSQNNGDTTLEPAVKHSNIEEPMVTDVVSYGDNGSADTIEETTKVQTITTENGSNKDKLPNDEEAMDTEDTLVQEDQEILNEKSQIENGDSIVNNSTVPELESDQLLESSSTSKPTLNLGAKTKIKLNIIPKPDDEIVEVPVVKPKIDVIDVVDDETGGTEVVSEDELPPPPTKEKVDGAEEVSDEELPAGPKPDIPPEGAEEVSDEELPEAEDVSDDELQEIKSKLDVADSKPNPCKDADAVLVTLNDTESTTGDRKRVKNEDCSMEDAKKPRNSSPEEKCKKLPELQQYWKCVKENPSDFTSWTYLLKYVDQESDIEAAEEAYSTFLAQYPYCYGYWRKFADYERKKGTQTKCEEVFDEGLKAIPLSVDLWIHYLNYVKSVHIENPDYIRKQFERSVDICGLEFRADALWDSFIKWEVSQKNLLGAMQLFDRVLEIPLHGNATHLDNFQTFVASHSPKDILSLEDFVALRKELLALKKEKNEGDDRPPGDEDYTPPEEDTASVVLTPEEINAMREKIALERRKKHKETVPKVAERRPFEEKIKRPYFHVKALEKCQLKNWKVYLDFEIKKGDEKRIQVLFERCLIACALYEEFWHKYICYLLERPTPDYDKIRELFHKACRVHHPKKVNLQFEWAAFEEMNGNAEKAHEILENIEKEHPQLIEISMRRIALQKRRKLSESVCQLYEKCIIQWSREKDKQNYFDVIVKYARYCAIILKDVDKAVEVLMDAIEMEKESRDLQSYTRLNLQLIDIELHRPEIDINRIVTYLDTMLERSSLSVDQKFQIVTKKLELLEEYGDNIVLINKTVEEFRSLAKQNKKSHESRISSSTVPGAEYKEKIPTQVISAVRKPKPPAEPPAHSTSTNQPPLPQHVFYPGPPSQAAPFIPPGPYPPPQQPPQYPTNSVPPPPQNFNGPYPMDPNSPMMYAPSPYPMYGNANFSGGNWPPGPGGFGPGNFPMNPPPNQRRY